MSDIFDSAVRSSGDFAGVFESDLETSYFYLYRIDEREGNKVRGAIMIATGSPTFGAADVAIFWSREERYVGLNIKDIVLAVFDCETAQGFGGIRIDGGHSQIPADLLAEFARTE